MGAPSLEGGPELLSGFAAGWGGLRQAARVSRNSTAFTAPSVPRNSTRMVWASEAVRQEVKELKIFSLKKAR